MRSVMEDKLFLDPREALAVRYPADGDAIVETASCNGYSASCVLDESLEEVFSQTKESRFHIQD